MYPQDFRVFPCTSVGIVGRESAFVSPALLARSDLGQSTYLTYLKILKEGLVLFLAVVEVHLSFLQQLLSLLPLPIVALLLLPHPSLELPLLFGELSFHQLDLLLLFVCH